MKRALITGITRQHRAYPTGNNILSRKIALEQCFYKGLKNGTCT